VGSAQGKGTEPYQAALGEVGYTRVRQGEDLKTDIPGSICPGFPTSDAAERTLQSREEMGIQSDLYLCWNEEAESSGGIPHDFDQSSILVASAAGAAAPEVED